MEPSQLTESLTQEQIEALKVLKLSEGWKTLRGLLARLLTAKERVKAEAIRRNEPTRVILNQGEIDSLNYLINLVETIKRPSTEGEERYGSD